jgi:hypothetical protein
LGKNIQNYCHDKVARLSQTKEKDYKTIPLESTFEIYKAIEANLPSEFVFDKHTVIYTWNADKENSSKTTLDRALIRLLNETHPAERGEMYQEYMEHPERFENADKGTSSSSRASSRKASSSRASSRKASSSSRSGSNLSEMID